MSTSTTDNASIIPEKKAMRHRKMIRDSSKGIRKPAIRRLAHRAGIERIDSSIYAETRSILRDWLDRVLRDAIVRAEHGRRKTITVPDVKRALERQGRPLYGFSK
jgi:histone H4